MKVVYDPKDDMLRIRFNNFPIERSHQDAGGTIFDFDGNGRLVAIEMPQASERVGHPCIVEDGIQRSTFFLKTSKPCEQPSGR